MKTMWGYGRQDREDLGDFTFMTCDTEEEAKRLAFEASAEVYGWDGGTPPPMVVLEIIPRLVGMPELTAGEVHGPGDKDPDAYDKIVWVPAEEVAAGD